MCSSECENDRSEENSLPYDGHVRWDETSSTDDEFFGELGEEVAILLRVALATINTSNFFFNANELEEGGSAIHMKLNSQGQQLCTFHLEFYFTSNFKFLNFP